MSLLMRCKPALVEELAREFFEFCHPNLAAWETTSEEGKRSYREAAKRGLFRLNDNLGVDGLIEVDQ